MTREVATAEVATAEVAGRCASIEDVDGGTDMAGNADSGGMGEMGGSCGVGVEVEGRF